MLYMVLDSAQPGVVCEIGDAADLHAHEETETRSFVREAPRLAQAALASAGRRADEIDMFAVVLGPGSWTGLRVGVTFMRALAHSVERRIIGLPKALLRAAPYEGDETRLLVIDPLRRDAFHVSEVDLSNAAPRLTRAPEMISDIAAHLSDVAPAQFLWPIDNAPPAAIEALSARRAPAREISPGLRIKLAARLADQAQAPTDLALGPAYGAPHLLHRAGGAP